MARVSTLYGMTERWSSLADTASRLMREHQGGAVADRYPPVVWRAVEALTDAIVATGVDRRDAEYAVTRWMITTEPIEVCAEAEQSAEARSRRRPAADPTR